MKQITLNEKLNVICKVKVKSLILRIEIANCLGSAPSSLSTVMSNKIKIIEGEIKCGAHSKNSMNINLGSTEGLEKILLEWLTQMCSENIPISRPILCQKATDIILHLKI
jgi:hypothetical protein